MIRHSKSFFISMVIHILLLLLVIYTYKTYFTDKKEVSKARVCIKLCDLKQEKELTKIETKKIQKPKPKVKQKKIKKKEKPKAIKPKVLIIPVIKKIVEPEIIEEVNVELINEPIVTVIQPVIAQKTLQELENERRIRNEKITKEYVKLNTQEISRLLRENLYYPRSARKRGVTGKIMVKFNLKKNADVCDVHILKSNSDILSRAAKKTIESLAGKFPKPQEDITLHIPISYSLK